MTAEGKLIVLEGVDETTLDTQLERLYRWLCDQGVRAAQTQEPTRGPVGALIRLSRQKRLHFDPTSLALLWVADRLDHLGCEGGVRDWLSEGRVVLCARYVMYSLAVMADQVDVDWMHQINARCTLPDLTLYVEPPPSAPQRNPLQEQYERAFEAARRAGENVVRVPDHAEERLTSHRSADQTELACRAHISALLWPGETR